MVGTVFVIVDVVIKIMSWTLLAYLRLTYLIYQPVNLLMTFANEVMRLSRFVCLFDYRKRWEQIFAKFF